MSFLRTVIIVVPTSIRQRAMVMMTLFVLLLVGVSTTTAAISDGTVLVQTQQSNSRILNATTTATATNSSSLLEEEEEVADATTSVVTCRFTVFDTMTILDTIVFSDEAIRCIPILPKQQKQQRRRTQNTDASLTNHIADWATKLQQSSSASTATETETTTFSTSPTASPTTSPTTSPTASPTSSPTKKKIKKIEYEESSYEYDVDEDTLPAFIRANERPSIRDGNLVVQISNARIDVATKSIVPIGGDDDATSYTILHRNRYDDDGNETEELESTLTWKQKRLVDAASKISTVVSSSNNNSTNRHRHLEAVTGTLSVAFVRIVTTNSEPQHTVNQIRKAIFTSGESFINQFASCSGNQIRFVPSVIGNGVIQVRLNDKATTDFERPRDIIDYAQDIIKNTYDLTTVKEIADKVIMCVPPGYGDWAGAAGVNHWRAQMNDKWCISLTGVAHEIGHTIGLLHSYNAEGEEYGDRSGYMGSGYPNPSWPKKCFNARDNDYLGWYSNRKTTLSPRQKSDNTVLDLTSFVDYGSNQLAQNDKVIVNLDDRYYLQYNVAKKHNAGTEHNKNQVVIARRDDGGSTNLAGLVENRVFEIKNYMNTGDTLWIVTCVASKGDGGVDRMQMSIAFDKSICPNGNAGLRLVRNNGGGNVDASVIVHQINCFSANSLVDIYGRGHVPMSSVQVGDRIRTSLSLYDGSSSTGIDAHYERIYSFGHRSASTVATFIQLYINDDNNPLEMTHEHLIYIAVQSNSIINNNTISSGIDFSRDSTITMKAVRADDVRVGDRVQCIDDDGSGKQPQYCTVTDISSVTRNTGVYAPMTPSGKLLVNDVLVSNYVGVETTSSRSSSIFFANVLQQDGVMHVLTSPYRLACTIESGTALKQWFGCGTIDNDGINTYVFYGRKVLDVFLTQCFAVQILMALSIITVTGVCHLYEIVFCNTSVGFNMQSIVTAVVSIILVYYYTCSNRNKRRSKLV